MRVAVSLLPNVGKEMIERIATAIKGMFGEDVTVHISGANNTAEFIEYFDKVNYFTTERGIYSRNVRVVDKSNYTINDLIILGTVPGFKDAPSYIKDLVRNKAVMVMGDLKIPQVDAVLYYDNDTGYFFPTVEMARKNNIKVIKLVEEPKKAEAVKAPEFDYARFDKYVRIVANFRPTYKLIEVLMRGNVKTEGIDLDNPLDTVTKLVKQARLMNKRKYKSTCEQEAELIIKSTVKKSQRKS